VTGFIRRHDVGCAYITLCAALLGLTEFTVVTVYVAPVAPDRDDWLIGTLLLAPAAAHTLLVAILATGWALITTIRVLRWITGKIHPQHPTPQVEASPPGTVSSQRPGPRRRPGSHR
jgi:hypothetical protein